MLARAKTFVARHERRLTAVAFLFGFLWDSLTLTRIDRLFENLVLAGYLVAAFASIALLHAHGAGRFSRLLPDAGSVRRAFAERGEGLLQFLLPFAFGGLFSGLLIFYSRSGPLITSAPFFLVLGLLFFGNEFFKRHYARFVFQMSVFFAALFSWSALMVPVLLRRMGDDVFLLSGAFALALFALALRLLRRFGRDDLARSRRVLFPVIAMIFFSFNFLYFNNMIPPIPLSLKEIGVYHSVSREGGEAYRLSFEPAPWYALGQATSKIFHRAPDAPAYAWSAVYAPTKLETDIVHRWEYRDETQNEWVTANVVRFPISGGREEGFRGYSVKERLAPGRWRISVETPRGAIIGRFAFTVVAHPLPKALVTEIR